MALFAYTQICREEVMVIVKLAEGFTPEDMPPEKIKAHAERLAVFKRPRYIAHASEFPRTATNKIAKVWITFEHLFGLAFDCRNMTEMDATTKKKLMYECKERT
jgi:hypothetical protein